MGLGEWFHHRRHSVLDLAEIEAQEQRAARERIIDLGHYGAPGSDVTLGCRSGYGVHVPSWPSEQRMSILTARDMEVAAGERPGERPRPTWDGPTEQRPTVQARPLDDRLRMLSGLPDGTTRFRRPRQTGQ